MLYSLYCLSLSASYDDVNNAENLFAELIVKNQNN